MSTGIVIGDLTQIYRRYCMQFKHRHNRNRNIKYPSSVLNDVDSFADILQRNPPKSLQLALKDKVSLEDFFNLLIVIGENCKGLECLGITLKLEECEKEIERTMVDLELEEVKDLERLTVAQTACVQVWFAFIETVAPTFQHISIFGDLTIPYFAIQKIIKECPNFASVQGEVSSKASVISEEQLREPVENGTDYYIRLLPQRDFDLASMSGRFNNLRVFDLNWNSCMDLSLIENSSLVNLHTIYLVNQDIDELSSTPTVDLFFPENSRLADMTITGLDLSRASWEKFGERTKLLRCIDISKGGILQSEYIVIIAKNLPRLEVLRLDTPNNITGGDLIPLLKLSEEITKFELYLDVMKNNICSNDEIEHSAVQIMECFKNISEEILEGDVRVTIEYWHHVGGYEFLRETVEELGFTFEVESDSEKDYKIWSINLKNSKLSHRCIRLHEKNENKI